MNGNTDFLAMAGFHISGKVSQNVELSLQEQFSLLNVTSESFSVKYNQHRFWVVSSLFWYLDHNILPLKLGYGYSF